MGILDRRNRSVLLGNIVSAVAAALLANGLIALENPSAMSSSRSIDLEPPGYVIGIVWVILFACLGAARWLVIASPGGCPRTGALAVANHVRRQSLLAGRLLVPVLAWLAFATILVALEWKA